jgi:hypothetical protein
MFPDQLVTIMFGFGYAVGDGLLDGAEVGEFLGETIGAVTLGGDVCSCAVRGGGVERVADPDFGAVVFAG